MSIPQTVQNNQGASVALGVTPIGVVITWLTGNVLHWQITGEVVTTLSGFMIAFALTIHKYGVVGLWNKLLHGNTP